MKSARKKPAFDPVASSHAAAENPRKSNSLTPYLIPAMATLTTAAVVTLPLVVSEGSLAFGTGMVSVVFWVLGIAIFTLPGFAAHDYRLSRIDPDSVRLMVELGYLCVVLAGTISALAVAAASAEILRSRVLPRWSGWLGVVLAVLLLTSVVFVSAFLFWGWIVLTALLHLGGEILVAHHRLAPE